MFSAILKELDSNLERLAYSKSIHTLADIITVFSVSSGNRSESVSTRNIDPKLRYFVGFISDSPIRVEVASLDICGIWKLLFIGGVVQLFVEQCATQAKRAILYWIKLLLFLLLFHNFSLQDLQQH
jgi:hypothetical protein